MPETGTRSDDRRPQNSCYCNVLRSPSKVLPGCNTFAKGKIVASVLQVLVSSLQRVPHVHLLPERASNPEIFPQ